MNPLKLDSALIAESRENIPQKRNHHHQQYLVKLFLLYVPLIQKKDKAWWWIYLVHFCMLSMMKA